MDIKYFRAIHNAIETNTSAERQAETVKRQIEKNFSKTYGTKLCMVNGIPQELILKSITGNYKQRTIITRPSETIYAGDIVDCMGQKWIVLDIDPDRTIYTKAMMQLCNVKAKWISKKTKRIVERYGWAENVTKYSSGVRDSNTVQRTEFQIKIRFGLDEETAILKRDSRFLLDLNGEEFDTSLTSGHPDAYILTNRDVFSRAEGFGQKKMGGIVELTMTEALFNSDTDNAELMIADYYNTEHIDIKGLSAEIAYKGDKDLKSNGNFKRFSAIFRDGKNEVLDNITPLWTVATSDGYQQYLITEQENNDIKIKIQDGGNMIGRDVIIVLHDQDKTVEHKLTLKVKGLL